MHIAQTVDTRTVPPPVLSLFNASEPACVAMPACVAPATMPSPSRSGFDRQAGAGEFDPIASTPTSAGVAALLAAFRTTGGMVTGDELTLMFKDLKLGDVTRLGRGMASREICSFQWRSAFWIPMFQFDLHTLSFKHALRNIFAELTPVQDDWMLAVWFAQPNASLGGRKPVDLLASDFAAVYEAAQDQRRIAAG